MFDVNKPQFFDEDGNFKAAWLADRIIQNAEKHIFTTRDRDNEIWRYNGGDWLPDGRNHIQEETKRLLGEKFSKNRNGEVIAHIQASTLKEMPPEPPANMISLANGIYDLNTETLGNYSPDYFFLNKIPVEYKPDACCPKIIKFFSEIVGEPEKSKKEVLLFEIAGYCLYRSYKLQKAFVFVGEGCNGKSTYISLIKTLLGEKNVSGRTMQELENNRFAAACLKGKLANTFADLPPSAMKTTSFFKTLTGGDFIETEKKYGREPAKFTNTAKLIYSANKTPVNTDNTKAFYRRIIQIEFPFSFVGKENKNLLEELTAPEEISGFLNMSLQALKRLLERGTFAYEQTIEETERDYRHSMSSVSAFIDDCLEPDPTMFELTEHLYDAYIQYCKDNKQRIESETSFVVLLKQYFPGPVESVRPYIATEKRQRKALAGLKMKGKTSAKPTKENGEYGSLI